MHSSTDLQYTNLQPL